MYEELFKLYADLLKAISCPKRLEIIHLLRNKSITVGEMQQMLDLPQANLSQHLTILRQQNVVKTKKNGKHVFYSLAHLNFIKASDLIRQVLVDKYNKSDLADELTIKMSDLVPVVSDCVCGMRVSKKTASFGYKYKGQNYFFCASGCLRSFKKNPTKYIKKN